MKRRRAIQGIVLFTLGTQVLYSCKDKYAAIKSLPIPHLPLENNDISLIEDLSARILPIQQIEVLKDHTPVPFILTMAHDCQSPEDRDVFVKGYQNFDDYVKEKYGKSYSGLAEEEYTSLLESMEEMAGGENAIPEKIFFDFVKSKSIQYLTSTEHFMTNYRYYEMAPARYDGCKKIS